MKNFDLLKGLINSQISTGNDFHFGSFYSIVKSLIPTKYSAICDWTRSWEEQNGTVANKVSRGLSIDTAVSPTSTFIDWKTADKAWTGYTKEGEYTTHICHGPKIDDLVVFQKAVSMSLHQQDTTVDEDGKEVSVVNSSNVGSIGDVYRLMFLPSITKKTISSFMDWKHDRVTYDCPRLDIAWLRVGEESDLVIYELTANLVTLSYRIKSKLMLRVVLDDHAPDVYSGGISINLASQSRKVYSSKTSSFNIVQCGIGPDSIVFADLALDCEQQRALQCIETWQRLYATERVYNAHGVSNIMGVEILCRLFDAVLCGPLSVKLNYSLIKQVDLNVESIFYNNNVVAIISDQEFAECLVNWINICYGNMVLDNCSPASVSGGNSLLDNSGSMDDKCSTICSAH